MEMKIKIKIKMLWWLEIKEYEQRHHSATEEEASKLALHAPVTGFENVKIDDLARKTRIAHEEGQAVVRCLQCVARHTSQDTRHKTQDTRHKTQVTPTSFSISCARVNVCSGKAREMISAKSRTSGKPQA